MDIEAATKYAMQLLEDGEGDGLYYHSPSHTLDVVSSAVLLTELEGIPEYEASLIRVAAYYHETGIMEGYDGHEERAGRICWKVLPGFGFSEEEIGFIVRLILATSFNKTPESIHEEVICDADLDYLGREDYFEISEKLRNEWVYLGMKQYSDDEWRRYQVDFLKRHRYFTQSACELREDGKRKNIAEIEQILKKPDHDINQ